MQRRTRSRWIPTTSITCLSLLALGPSAVAATSAAAPLSRAGEAPCSPSWIPTFGEQLGSAVAALAVHDDGDGPALYAGGYFASADGVEVNFVAKRSGTSWSALDGGMNNTVLALTVFDGALHAAGAFSAAGGADVLHVARWNGASWDPLGVGTSSHVQTLTVHDDGGGPALYAGGSFTSAGGGAANRIAKWDGTSWSPLGSGTDGSVYALTAHDDGSGAALYAGGDFLNAGGVASPCIARWDGASWTALGSGMSGGLLFTTAVYALTTFDDGSGPALYAGGDFASAGGVPAASVARWDGASWSALDSGTDGLVTSLAAFDDGNVPALYAAGEFTSASGVGANRIAKWDGTSWAPLDNGTSGLALALTAFDDGSGPALFVGGAFTSTFDSEDRFLAKWGCSAGDAPSFCSGDAAACPCGNGGARGRGCDNAQSTGGVSLTLVAQTTSPNGATLAGSGFPSMSAPTAIVIRSSALDPARPVVFGDGLRCVSAMSLVRLSATVALGGTSTHALGHAAMAGSGEFYYQIWYRNTPSTFCDPLAAFNLSNGRALTWR